MDMNYVILSLQFLLLYMFKIGFSSVNGNDFMPNSYIDFYHQPEDTVVTKKQSIVLNCDVGTYLVSGNTTVKNTVLPANITWLKDGQPIRLKGIFARRTCFKNGSLSISNMYNSDRGLYMCVANHKSKVLLSRKANVTVAVFNQFSYQPRSTSRQVGTYVRFSCNFGRATPQPFITWYKNDVSLGNSSSWENSNFSKHVFLLSNDSRTLTTIKQTNSRSVVLPNGILQITNISVQDAGQYRCTGTNAANTRQLDKFHLTVVSDQLLEGEPHFVIRPSSTRVVAGQLTLFECAVTGYPASSIRWLKNTTEIDFRLDQRLRQLGSNNLLIANTSIVDQGEYSCVVKNADPPLISTATLTVFVPPYFTETPSQLVVAHIGCEVILPCKISGIPQPIITGYKDGELLNSTDFTEIKSGVLYQKITTVQDTGIYQCFGENDVGSVQATSNLVVVNEDGSGDETIEIDDRVYLDELAFNFAHLSWNRVGLLSATNYEVHVFDIERNSYETINTNLTRIILKELLRGHTMQVWVVPFTRFCRGSTSKKLIFTVPQANYNAGLVQNFAADALNSHTVSVTWDPPTESVQATRAYKVILKEIADESGYLQEVEVEVNTHVFDNLKKYTSYGVKVAVIYENGRVGPLSSQIIVKTAEDVPELSPVNITVTAESSDTALVRWDCPPIESVNGELLGYRIRYKEVNTRKSSNFRVDPDATQFLIKKLRKNAEYSLRMQVFNAVQMGPLSKRIVFHTPKKQNLENRAPGKPRVWEHERYSNEIVLVWFPPEDDVYIREYVIGWGRTTPDEQTVKVNNEKQSYRIDNLEPSTEYFISVGAANQAGVGESFLLDARTKAKEDVLEELYPPLGVHIDVLTHTTLNITWHDSDKEKHARYYLVRYKTNVPAEPRMRLINATVTNCLIHGLRPHTLYEVAVRVIEGNRRSSWSMTEAAITLESRPSSAPTDLTVMPVEGDSTSVQVNWQPPAEPNGELNGYLIYYTTNIERNTAKWIMEPVKGDKLSATIKGLTPDTQYYFKALAENLQGAGPDSNVLRYTTAKLPADHNPMGSQGTKVSTLPWSLPTWVWYIIIGGICLLVLLVVMFATLVVCRNGCCSRRSSKQHIHSNGASRYGSSGVNGARRSNGSVLTPADSWPRPASSVHSPSMHLCNPDEVEMNSMRTPDGQYYEDMSSVMRDYYCVGANPSERIPLNTAHDLESMYFHSYPYPTRHSEVRDPNSTDFPHLYQGKEQYDHAALQLPSLQFSRFEPTRFDFENRYSVPTSPIGQDFNVDSAYGSDHPTGHHIDEPSPTYTENYKCLSNGRSDFYYRDNTLKSGSSRSSPSAGTNNSARHSRTASVDMKLANVEEFVRGMKATPVDDLVRRQKVESET